MRPAILLLLSLSLAAAVRIEVSTKAPVKNAPQLLLFT